MLSRGEECDVCSQKQRPQQRRTAVPGRPACFGRSACLAGKTSRRAEGQCGARGGRPARWRATEWCGASDRAHGQKAAAARRVLPWRRRANPRNDDGSGCGGGLPALRRKSHAGIRHPPRRRDGSQRPLYRLPAQRSSRERAWKAFGAGVNRGPGDSAAIHPECPDSPP